MKRAASKKKSVAGSLHAPGEKRAFPGPIRLQAAGNSAEEPAD